MRALIALLAGLLLGTVGALAGWPFLDRLVAIAEPVGGLWFDALMMTIVPLVFALVVTGIVSTVRTAAAGRVTAYSIGLFVVVLIGATTFSALLTPALLGIWPLPPEAAEAIRTGSGGVAEIPVTNPSAGDWLRSLVMPNVFRAAVEGAILPLVVFALLFGFAATRTGEKRRATLADFFQALSDTLLIIVRWVLWAAPVGVFALALVVSARTGLGAVGALVHYVVLVSAVCIAITLLAYVLAVLGGRMPLAKFARGMIPAQSVALSTLSSLATLPAMIDSAQRLLGLPPRVVDVTLPLAVSLFRVTSPSVNLAVAIYLAHLYGVPLGPGQLATGVVVAILIAFGGIGVASQVTFVALIAPICIAMGVPVAVLGLLIAVETIPDFFRTVGNVTADVAVTTVVARRVD